jgi:hypothetical protein
MSFDPFGPTEAEGENGGAAAPDLTGKKDTSGDGNGQPSVQPQEPDPSKSPTANPEMELIKKQLKEANEALAAMRDAAKAPAKAEPTQPQGGASEADTIPAYNFNIPDGLVDKLASEDPRDRKEGLGVLIQGASRAVHKAIRDEVMQHIAPAVVRLAVEQVRGRATEAEAMQTIRGDFYGSYPELNKPELIPLIGQMAAQLAAELGVNGYTPEFKAALAARAKALFNLGGGAVVTQAPKQPVINRGGGTRVAPSAEQQLSNEIMELAQV